MAPPFHLTVLKTFDDLQGDFFNQEIFVRLIHYWEARNFTKGNTLMGIELLLIDSKPNTIYKLNRFTIRPSKLAYRVSPHKHGISFTNKTTFAAVHEGNYQIDSQHFRLRNLEDFTNIVDKHTDLFGE
ncbi:hypothetical protein YC2023_050728 [Brassica napus]